MPWDLLVKFLMSFRDAKLGPTRARHNKSSRDSVRDKVTSLTVLKAQTLVLASHLLVLESRNTKLRKQVIRCHGS
jgi:hypothetical protein